MQKWSWLFALLAACGDNLIEQPKPPAAPSFEESAHGPPPQLVSAGGPVLTAPRTQPIFWSTDAAYQAKIEDFDQKLAIYDYWGIATSEYGVGYIHALPSIVTTDPVPTTGDELTTWLAQKLDGTHTAEGWPAEVDPQTIYSVFLPPGAVLHDPSGDSCAAYGAYHDEAMGAHGESIVYALMPRCNYGGPLIDDLTASYSHELIEAATDPLVETDGAFGEADADNYVMGYTPGAETGDYCEYLSGAYIRMEGYEVQRTWSNKASLAGKDPCVPAPATPYIAAVPMFTAQAPIDDPYTGAKLMTRAALVAVNQSTTVEVQLISDRPTEPFTVSAFDSSAFYGGSPELTFAWDATTGKNGDVLHLTITRKQAGQMPGSEFMLETRPGTSATAMTDAVSQWWGYVGN
ncbi:MAG TPA: hypothetical protein VFQ65_34185 [Kofleriaceae bacterium]|nr:hypothetical protein [Kofleriaceae bacterium]